MTDTSADDDFATALQLHGIDEQVKDYICVYIYTNVYPIHGPASERASESDTK